MGKSELASPAEAQRQVELIRAVYELGRAARQSPSNLAAARQAAEPACGEGRLALARRMTHPRKGYTEEQLDALCALVLEHRPTLGLSLVAILLAIPWPHRTQFQRSCARENWSRRELVAAKVTRFRPRSTGGRRPGVTPADAVVELKAHANAYCRLLDQMDAAILDGLPADLRHRAQAAQAAMTGLHEAARAHLQKTQRG